MRARKIFFVAGLVTLAIAFIQAQSPVTVVVPAASQATTAVSSPPVASNSESAQATIKMLEQMRAKNAETLQKQEATLQKLDELQQAAEELRIYAKRG